MLHLAKPKKQAYNQSSIVRVTRTRARKPSLVKRRGLTLAEADISPQNLFKLFFDDDFPSTDVPVYGEDYLPNGKEEES